MLTRVPLIALSLASSAAAQTSSVTSIFFGGLAGIDQGDPNTLFATVVASVVAVQPTATVFAINCRSSNTPNSNISGRSSNDDDEGESDEGSDDEGENYYGNADDDDDNGEDGENGDDGDNDDDDDNDDNNDDDPCAGPPIIITANPTLFVLQSTITAPGTTDAETTGAPGTLTMSSRCELTGTTAGECSYFVGGANATAMGVDATDIMTAPVVQPLLTTEITFTPVTITAGLEKLSAGASSTNASGVTATATGAASGASSNGTGTATGKPAASKSGATGAAQSGNGAPGVGAGLAGFVPLAAVLGWLFA
ncbi:MAG: hypothetical protein M1822_006449 [Bathelium mastoideum]|nr:MAG: hypothetical protein M1822_006449 [Bathelium mastoideum]